MEIVCPKPSNVPVKAVLLDFDGTLSTLRYGWEEVMAPLMAEHLGPGSEAMVWQYIDISTGIQTVFQMKWLADRVRERQGVALDPWDYKEIYNDRLMWQVDRNKADLASGAHRPEDFLIAGARPFLERLRALGVAIHVASGTDHPDVMREAKALGLLDLFDSVSGAPPREEACSKEKVMRDLARDQGLRGAEVCVIGDGKVEIGLGRELGARCLGIASDEARRQGVHPAKRERLLAAGAEAIAGDFLEMDVILAWMNLQGGEE